MSSYSPPNESEDVFEVERIMGMTKTKGKRTLYRVRWVGYGPDYDTWEPYENLDSCRQMVDEFIRENERRKERAQKRAEQEPPAPDVNRPTTSGAANDKRAQTWKYVTQDDDEYDTLKDKFWRDLEQGKVDVFKAGDMYSKVKASGRASRPKSFKEMFQNKLPVVEEAKSHKSHGASRSKGSRRKSASTPDSDTSLSPTDPGGSGGHMNKARHVRKASTEKARTSHSQSQYEYDTTSTGSFDTGSVSSSTEVQSVHISEDSGHGFGEVEVKEDIVGVVPILADTSLTQQHFQQISLEKDESKSKDLSSSTAPSSVASSTATSASSSNESGIILDSRSLTESTPHTSSQSTSREATDSEGDRKRKMPHVDSKDLKRSRSHEGINLNQSASQVNKSSRSSTEFPDSGPSQSTQECYSTGSKHPTQPVSGLISGLESSGEDISAMALGPEQLSLNQIQPTIGNLVLELEKPALNNNRGETGDEEYEFDLDEIDVTDFEGKIAPRITSNLPDNLDLSNSELHELVKSNDYERVVRALRTKKSYDLEQPDNMGCSLAMIAAQHGFDDMLELLVLRGANVNGVMKSGTTALILASEQGLRCTVALLLEMGAHINCHNHEGETALIKAVRCAHKHIVKLLLDQGANFASPFNMDTPLRWARHQRDILDLLNAHIARVKAEFEHQVQITLNNTARINCALFPMQCFTLREAEKLKVVFKHELQPTRSGVGMLLFIAHACITPTEVRCRFYGPCAVLAAILNGVKLRPLTEEGNFVMSFCPLHNGRNELELLLAKAPTSKAKLVICAYKAQLI